MTFKLLPGLAFLAAVAACGPAATQDAETPNPEQPAAGAQEPIRAALTLSDGSPGGQVTMTRGPLGLLFTIDGQNWPEGWHGAHLHSVGTCDAPAFEGAGGHVNHETSPRPHGLLNWNGGPDHGDLQNVYAHSDGIARAEVYLAGSGVTPSVGDMADADGLALVIHANRDDHLSQPIGGAGDRIACAVLSTGGSTGD